MKDLEGKVVIVTGGTRGIGLETVKAFLEKRSKVILFGSKEESVEKAKEEIKNLGYNVDGYYPNLNNSEEVEKTIKDIYTKYGRIDVLINNAGMSANKKIEDTTYEEFKG